MDNGNGYLMDGALGRRLRVIRKRRGLTLKKVADEIGSSAGALSDVERHVSMPSLPRVWQLCVVYQVEMWQLLHPDWEVMCG